MANQINLKYVVNHVFMPLRLPQMSDQLEDDFSLDHFLARSFAASASRFLQGAAGETGSFGILGSRRAWKAALPMLEDFSRLHDSYPFTPAELKLSLTRLSEGPRDMSLPLFIRKQNSGLIFRVVDTSVVAEAFTVSLPNQEVMACNGRIVRSLPEVTVSFPVTYLRQDEFVSQLASVLARLNSDDIEGSKAHVVRVGSIVEEPRNPPSAKYILDWLFVTLSALEHTVAPPTRSVTKRTADDVLWDTTFLPWRRSGLWLVLKLALELTVGTDGYKVFMVFFMTDLLNQAVQQKFSDELIYLMQGKAARRAVKVEKGSGLPEFVRRLFDSSNIQATNVLKQRWKSVQPGLDNPAPLVPWSPTTLDHEADSVLTLPSAHIYISAALSRPPTVQRQREHKPWHNLRIQKHWSIPETLSFTSSFVSTPNQNDLVLALLDFEQQIDFHLHAWLMEYGPHPDLTQSLFVALQNYHSAATRLYVGNPEAHSQMMLTIFELWAAIDAIVVFTIPLLAEYPCEISPTLLQPLLLRKPEDLDRLSRIAQYLHSRQARAPSVFEPPNSESFPLRYFSTSSVMADEMNRIKRKAESDMSIQRGLLKQKLTEHASLIQKRDATPHHHPVIERPANEGGPIITKQGCSRCRLNKQVKNMKIPVYERPLPGDDTAAKHLVFEILCLQAFQVWRDATFYVLRDVLPLKNQPPQTIIYTDVASYSSVLGTRKGNPSFRLTLASTTKSFYTTHYRERKLPATEGDVIVNHALRWALFDTNSRTIVSSQSPDLQDMTLLSPLPFEGDPYKPLEISLSKCTHNVPQVLADHYVCSPSMSTHEYIAFGSLRAGCFVQWLNLAAELRSQVLSFNKVPVYQLVMQVVQHVGPVDSEGKLSWHALLDIPAFHVTLLNVMEDLLCQIEGNWQQITTMRSLVDITLRLLGARFDERTVTFLIHARATLFVWMSDQFSQLQLGSLPSNIIDFHRRRVYEIALICRQTFDVGEDYFAGICRSNTQLHILLFSHLVLNLVTHTPFDFSAASGVSGGVVDTIMRGRDHRLIHRLEDIVCQRCVDDPTAINTAIQSLWPHLETTTQKWAPMTAPNVRWLESTCPARGQVPLRLLHFNILTGQLLVDGRSLGSLPIEIVQSKSYQRLMPNTNLHVGPSYLAGTEYMSLSPLHGYLVCLTLALHYSLHHPARQIHFGRVKGNVLIRASRGSVDSDVLEFLPGEVFENNIPKSLVQNYTHWIHLGLRVVEFRPERSPWLESHTHWHLVNSLHGGYHLRQGLYDNDAPMLVSRQSRSFLMLFSQVRAIEDISWVVILYSPTTRSTYPLKLELPRYLLTFLLDGWRLNSADFLGCYIDADQSIGTLHGLTSKLVLRQSLLKSLESAFPQSRRVLIPNGDIHHVETQSHVNVTIDTQPTGQARVRYFVYHIDTELGRLSLEESTLESRLFKVYLHALTSRALPDSLTSRRGVEEALNELNSAACITFEALQPCEIDILLLIQRLTPGREFYPRHLCHMQQVNWQRLPSLVQLTSFHIRVSEILEYDASLTLFQPRRSPKSSERPNSVYGSPHLLVRAAHRESVAAPLNILTKPYIKLVARDAVRPPLPSPKLITDHYRGARMVATMLDPKPYMFNDENTMMTTWLQSPWPVIVMDPSLTSTYLNFHPSMFNASITDLRNRWFGMFYTAFNVDIAVQTKQFALLFSVSALFYSSSEQSQTIARRLITAAQHPTILSFRNIASLKGRSVDICSANVVNSDSVSAIILKHRSSDIPLADVDILSQKLTQWYLYQSSTSTQLDITLSDRFTVYFNHQAHCNLTEELMALYHQWQTAADLRRCVTKIDTTFASSIEHPSGGIQHLPRSASLSFNCSIPTITHREYATDHILASIHSSSPLPFVHTPTSSVDDLKKSSIAFASVGAGAETKLESVIQRLFDISLPIPMHFALDLRVSKNELLASVDRIIAPSKSTENYRTAIPSLVNKKKRRSTRTVLAQNDPPPPTLNEAPALSEVLELYTTAYDQFTQLLKSVLRTLSPIHPYQNRLQSAARWPQPTLLSLLSRLTWVYWDLVPQTWKEALVDLSLRLLRVQQYRRILHALFTQEDIPVQLPGPIFPFPRMLALRHPDWLLIQIENNVLARPHQLGIATEMFQPNSESNSTLQLNMGEGKSSVIVPFVASSLANGKHLVRVVSLKPLIRSMMAILTNRVASLPNRRVAYFPFSRDILRQPGDIFGQLSKLYTNLKQDHGILLAQPEHILSPKLLSIERILSSSPDGAQGTSASHFFELIQGSARDILDECDEELSVGFQLIYTLGEPKRFDWNPHRWLFIQQVLSYCIHVLPDSDAGGLLFDEPWSFPHIHCKTSDAINIVSLHVNKAIGQQICYGRIFDVSLAHLSRSDQRLLSSFATQRHPSPGAVALADSQHHHLRSALLVLRGLFAFKILPYCLVERRWRVDYGLDPRRSMVAIPFTANDLPSPASEFAHPDLVIVLTCLAYHYYGLTGSQVKDSVAHLLTLSNRMALYVRWVHLIPFEYLPQHSAARNISGVNLDDQYQLDMLCRLLRRNRATVDFYLQEFVFPKSAKSFPHKLQTSGWDLAEHRQFLTTGFSGTKDNSLLLPRSISFLETPGQAETNAMVLLHVLNSDAYAYYITPRRPTGRQLVALMEKVDKSIRVLLDVGAQVLDMSNFEIVTYWLSLSTTAEAAIFLNDEDRLTVLRRDGSTESLQSSTYRQQTDKCVVYLDDAHTRGTDLKLPRNWKAAVTLGKKVTKDRLVQGCMRMRQLASGQSLVFFAPPEVDNEIRTVANKTAAEGITVEDVVMWAMLETCKDIERNAPIWAMQGLDYQERSHALDTYSEDPALLSRAWLQPEAKSLYDMFHPEAKDDRLSRAFDISTLGQSLTRLGIIRNAIHSGSIDEEQEREVTHEVEVEPEISPPVPLIPAVPSFARSLLRLACHGEFSRDSFFSVDQYLWIHFDQQWVRCKQAKRNAFHPNILITLDFTRTIKDSHPVEFMQPVLWILIHYPSNPVEGPVLIILSQFEANSLLPYADQFQQCRLHPYVATVSPAIRPFDRFDFFPIPADSTSASPPLPQILVAQLNLFSGQLYPTSYQDYLAMAHFLGFDITRKCIASPDGFVTPQNRVYNTSLTQDCAFEASPLSFFRQLFSLRRKAQAFHDTPVGYLLGGWLMSEQQYLNLVVKGLGAMGM